MARSPKALIIACEDYPQGEDIGQKLKDTLESARQFYQWLKEGKQLSPADIFVCCDSALVAGHPADRSFASTRKGVQTAVRQLVKANANNVTELYVYFSGHGVGYEQSSQQRGLDVLLLTDYVNRASSGDACINIGEFQAQMEIWLRGDDHYYFLDACRTVLKAGEIVPVGLGLALDPATAGDPTIYTLYSTKFGETASVNAKFPVALLSGLHGEGRAKARVKKSWWVQFDKLQKHIESRVDIPVDSSKLGGHDGLIAKLDGPFETPLKVRVDGAAADTNLELKVDAGVMQSFPFTGPSFEQKLAPNEQGYGFEVLFRGKPLRRLSPPDDDPMDLFEPLELRYQMPIAGAPLGMRGGPQILRVRPKAAKPIVEDPSRVQRSIASQVPNNQAGSIDFSETLGPIQEQHTALWLSVLGASRIIRDPRQFSKIGKFPLANFEDLEKDECAVYVLAGLDHAEQAQVSISPAAKPSWQPMDVVSGFEGVVHRREKVKPGMQLVSLALPDRPVVTFVTQSLPNRAALIVITEDPGGKIDARQMLLPIYTLAKFLPWQVTERLKQEGLRLVRYLVLQQDRFAKRESLAPPDGQERRELQELLFGKWLDPLLALTAIYETVRRGDLKSEGPKLREALGNLQSFFGELPDVAVAQQILEPKKGKAAQLTGIPLLRESLMRAPKLMENLPLPGGLLDYGSIWTSWLGAVKSPVWKKK